MKITIFSDLHLHEWKEFAELDENGYNSRLVLGINVLDEIVQHAYKNGTALTCCGDLYHDGKMLNPTIAHFVRVKMWLMSLVKDQRNRSWFLPGQHDVSAHNGKITALTPFDGFLWDSFSYSDMVSSGNIALYFCPHRSNVEEQLTWLKYLKNVRKTNKDYDHHIFVGHFLVKEILEEDGAFVPNNSVSIKNLPPCDVAFLGDYHRHVRVENVISVGAPMHHDFGDAGTGPGGYLVYDTDTGKTERILLEDVPQFVSVGLDEDFPEGRREMDYHRLWFESQEDWEDRRSGIGGNWKVRPMFIKEERDVKKRTDIDLSIKPQDVIRKYCEHLKREDMVEKGIEYLEVKNEL